MPNISDTSVTSKPQLPFCPVCWERVEAETGKTDENGRAIHEECYDRQLKNTASSPKT